MHLGRASQWREHVADEGREGRAGEASDDVLPGPGPQGTHVLQPAPSSQSLHSPSHQLHTWEPNFLNVRLWGPLQTQAVTLTSVPHVAQRCPGRAHALRWNGWGQTEWQHLLPERPQSGAAGRRVPRMSFRMLRNISIVIKCTLHKLYHFVVCF